MILFPLLAATIALATTDDVIARVDGAVITRTEIGRRLESARGPTRPKDALEALVVEALLAAEARRMGLADSPEVAGYVRAETRHAAAEALVEKIAAASNFDDARLRAMFHATSDLASFESIVFEKREQAEQALQRIRGGSTLAAEAKKAVVSTLHPKPESAPPMMRGQLPAAVAAVVFAARAGEVIGPVQQPTGWSVIRLIRVVIGTDADFTARRESLVLNARAQAAAAARKHLGEQLRAKASVRVDEAFLRGIEGTHATPEQLEHAVATMNGSVLRYRDVYPSVRAIAAGGGHMAGAAVKIQIVWKQVEAELLQDEAMRQGLGNASSVVARRSDFERNALARAAAERIQAAAPAPSEDEILDFYRRNPGRYDKAFAQVLPAVAADAAAEKRTRALGERIRELRRKSSVSIDSNALARMGK